MTLRKCVAIDFDGVIHKYSRGWQGGKIYDPIDVTGIRVMQEAGYAVAIMTARDVHSIVDALPDDYPRTVIDPKCEIKFWDGGESGLDVLITNRKIAAVAYIDDRAVIHDFGDNWTETLKDVRALESWRKK